MVKANTYSTVAPALADLFWGTDKSDTTPDANGETVNFTVQSVFDLLAETGVAHPDSDASLDLWGGPVDNGAGIKLFGDTHATQANDVEIYSQTDLIYRFDDSSDQHRFYSPAGTQVMRFYQSGTSSYFKMGQATSANTTEFTTEHHDGIMRIRGGDGSGSYISLYGGSHASQAGDIIFFDGADNAFVFDNSLQKHAWSVSGTEVMVLDSGLVLGSPTGGDKGTGTLNATAVYDDDSLLSCYVFDAALDGDIDETKWDDRVPNSFDRNDGWRKTIKTHSAMRKFKSRLGTKYDPLDIDAYADHWKEKRHLSSMPNEDKFDVWNGMNHGKWIQRLVETVEIQAVHIDNLNQRLKGIGH